MDGLKIRNCGNYPEDPYRCVSGRCSYLCIDKPNKRKDGKDHTLFALVDGTVEFCKKGAGKSYVSVTPLSE